MWFWRCREREIDRTIDCVVRVRDECTFADVTDEVHLIDMDGVRNAIKYICDDKYSERNFSLFLSCFYYFFHSCLLLFHFCLVHMLSFIVSIVHIKTELRKTIDVVTPITIIK